LIFDHKNYQPQNNEESVLDCLLRHEVNIDYSCKSGTCQSCMLRSLQGDIDTNAQRGLKATAIGQGFFLPANKKRVRLTKLVSLTMSYFLVMQD